MAHGPAEHTAMQYACIWGWAACVKVLLDDGCSWQIPNIFGFTPLLHACVAGSAPCARLLLEHGAEPNQGDHFRQTPLHFACKKGREGCVRLLLEAGADTSAKNGWGQTPEDCTRQNYNDTPEDRRFACACLVRRADALRTERGLPAGAPLSLDWTESTHALLADEERAYLARALGALLLVDARREGGATLGREGALAFVAGLARVVGV